MLKQSTESMNEPIAVIGMGCRFPGGADSPRSFWKLLADGADGITEVPTDRWNVDRFYDADENMPSKMYMRAGGFLKERIDQFDALFFGLSPREAALLDPQQRILLEVAWEAMEDAGLVVDALAGSSTGVYVGGLALDNMMTQLHPDNLHAVGVHTAVSTMMTMLSNRLSYTFDLRGPSMSIDTACSSSLVALHQAAQAMWNGECNMALVGGVNIMHRPEYLMMLCKGGFVARDGRCKSFDARADGYGRGEGAGVVVLKPYADAVRDGDAIYALIRATGVNQDGRTDGITVPNPVSQEALVRRVMQQACLVPDELSYIEAHGTGTSIGDPLETSALAAAVGRERSPGKPITIGSVKANIGHLEAAAGIASVIKSALVVSHRQVPPVANLETPNPKIPFADWNLHLPRELEPMQDKAGELFVGINSFGYGGTNAHVILQDAPADGARSEGHVVPVDEPCMLPLSARSQAALRALAGSYAAMLSEEDAPSLRDLCHSAALRRTHHEARAGLVADNIETMRQRLFELADQGTGPGIVCGNSVSKDQKPVFVFTGMGPQWWAMGRELYQHEPVFRAAVEQCDAAFRKISDWRILDELLAPEEKSQMTVAHVSACTNFMLQVGLVTLLRTWGIEPAAVVGHSLGEIGAAWGCGALDLDSAIAVLYHRSRLLNRASGQGTMMSVNLSAESVGPYLAAEKGRVTIAAMNSPRSVTLTGDKDAMKRIADKLEKVGVPGIFMQVQMAYHSPYMEPLKDDMFAALQGVSAQTPTCPIYSSVTGGRVESDEMDVDYWWRNMRQPVYFAQAIEALIEDGCRVFLEIGPQPVLSSSIKQCLMSDEVEGTLIASLRRSKPERSSLQDMLAALYAAGSPLDWKKIYGGRGGRYVRLPAYPWQREAYWHETPKGQEARIGTPAHTLLGERVNAPVMAWESRLNNGLMPFLADHHVQGLKVLAGASYAELGLAIHAQLSGSGNNVLEDLEFHKALVIDARDEPVLHVTYDEEGREFNVHSRKREGGHDGDWQLHARGRLSFVAPAAAERVELAPVQARCNLLHEGADHYQDMGQRGLEYGPYFQGVKRLWRDAAGDEVLAWIEGHDELAARAQGYSLHPTLFDSALQTLLTTLGAKGDNEVYIPVGIRRLTLHASPAGGFWCHGRLRQRWEGGAEGDVTLFDQNGTVIAVVSGVRAQALTKQDRDEARQIDHWLYDFRWDQAARAEAAVNNGRWLVLDDNGGVGRRLADELKKAGSGAVLQVPATLNFDRALEMVTAEVVAGVSGVVLLSALDATNDDLGTPAAVRLIQLVQSLAVFPQAPAIYVVTRDAQRVSDDEMQAGVAQATLIGGVRVAVNEYPNLALRSVDIDHQPSSLANLARELLAASPEDEVALRGSTRYVHRMQRRRAQDLQGDASQSAAAASHTEAPRAPAADEVQVALSKVRLDGLGMCSGVGRVAKIGQSVQGISLGDEVLVHLRGRVDRHATVAGSAVVTLPAADASSASDLPALAAAHYALNYLARLQAGERVLITSAASSVGLAAIQIARLLGAHVIALAAGPRQYEHLKQIAGIEVLDASTLGFVDQVRALSAVRPVDVVLNLAAGEVGDKAIELLPPFGRAVDLSNTAAPRKAPVANRSISYIDTTQLAAHQPAFFAQLLQETAANVRDGAYVAPLSREVDEIDIASAALDLAEADHVGGLSTVYGQAAEGKRLFEADASYLITGGFGGFGLAVAAWMAEQGAKHLVLVGRRGANTPEAVQAVDALRASGVQVLAAAADVAREADVEKLIAQIGAELPVLKGVFHTAAVLQDSPINQIEPEHVHAVMGPKAAGAWYLHRHTQALPLDYFVLFSSVACLVGGPGQASYAMSCEYQDALARHRRAMGLAATSINWGALAEVGMIARHGEVAKYFNVTGVGSFTPTQAVTLLGKALEWNPVQIGMAIMDWKQWGATYPTWAASPKYSELAVGEGEEEVVSGDRALVNTLVQMSDEERVSGVSDVLVGVLAQVLQLASDRIDRQQSLLNMGIDSLMAMELQMSVESKLGVKVSTLELMKGNNLTQLAQYVSKALVEKAQRKPAKAAASAAAPARTDHAASLIAQIDNLGDAEVDKLLAQLLPKQEIEA